MLGAFPGQMQYGMPNMPTGMPTGMPQGMPPGMGGLSFNPQMMAGANMGNPSNLVVYSIANSLRSISPKWQ